MKKIIRKADIILLAVLVVFGIFLAVVSISGGDGKRAVVRVDGRTYGIYDLAQDREVTILENGHSNQFIIRDGEVQMTEADCRNQDCVHAGAVSRTNQSIICLPNRVSITIEGGEADVDIIAE